MGADGEHSPSGSDLWAAGFIAAYGSRPSFLGPTGVIHFARWILLPETNKLLFMSNYDGAWETYLEDFIEKAHQGVTGIWSNTQGFPRTGSSVLQRCNRRRPPQMVDTPPAASVLVLVRRLSDAVAGQDPHQCRHPPRHRCGPDRGRCRRLAVVFRIVTATRQCAATRRDTDPRSRRPAPTALRYVPIPSTFIRKGKGQTMACRHRR